MNVGAFSWKQEGVISLWRYKEFPKKFGGWHLSGNDAGIKSLLALLQLLADNPSVFRTVKTTPPSASLLRVPNFQQGNAPWVAPSKLHLQCAPPEAPDTWEFPAELEPATLTVGGAFLPELVSALEGIPKGKGDFCIGRAGQSSSRLCFWWWLGAA